MTSAIVNERREGPFSFDAPKGWEDRSIQIFAAPRSSSRGLPANIVVAREPRVPGEGADAHVDRYLRSVDGDVPNMSVIERAAITASGRAAVRAWIQWTEGTLVLQQLRVHFAPEAHEPWIVTVACTATPDELSAQLSTLERLLASGRFGKPAASADVVTRTPASGFAVPTPVALRPPPPRFAQGTADELGVPFVPMPGDRRR
jgi:hypothetical protein